MKEGGATGFLWNFHRYRLVYIIILDPEDDDDVRM